jgi:VanZ family protein
MSHRLAWSLLLLLVLTLVIGTQIPGTLRNQIETGLHAPLSFSSWAHFVLFTCIALVLSLRPIVWPAQWVILMTFGLALATEGLQFFAPGRHPRLIDLVIDMAGTLLALLIARRLERRSILVP